MSRRLKFVALVGAQFLLNREVNAALKDFNGIVSPTAARPRGVKDTGIDFLSAEEIASLPTTVIDARQKEVVIPASLSAPSPALTFMMPGATASKRAAHAPARKNAEMHRGAAVTTSITTYVNYPGTPGEVMSEEHVMQGFQAPPEPKSREGILSSGVLGGKSDRDEKPQRDGVLPRLSRDKRQASDTPPTIPHGPATIVMPPTTTMHSGAYPPTGAGMGYQRVGPVPSKSGVPVEYIPPSAFSQLSSIPQEPVNPASGKNGGVFTQLGSEKNGGRDGLKLLQSGGRQAAEDKQREGIRGGKRGGEGVERQGFLDGIGREGAKDLGDRVLRGRGGQ